jgi:hypothetical protein
VAVVEVVAGEGWCVVAVVGVVYSGSSRSGSRGGVVCSGSGRSGV